jgi:hypothetical protein
MADMRSGSGALSGISKATVRSPDLIGVGPGRELIVSLEIFCRSRMLM